jgi:carbamoyl-phosphate synthase small subunit
VLRRREGVVEITSHNHGFAVDRRRSASAPTSTATATAAHGDVEVSHVNLNDDVCEGLVALDVPAFSVQYHPEAAPGPSDAHYLFDRFGDLMDAYRERSRAIARRDRTHDGKAH